MTYLQRTGFFLVPLILASLWHANCQAQASDKGAPSFSEAQATAGKTAYTSQCADCHGEELEGLDISPALAGARFDQNWRGNSAAAFSFHLRRMPPESVAEPGSLSDEDYTNILAFILASNDIEPSDAPLPSDMAALEKLTIPQLEGMDFDPDAPVVASAEQTELLENLPLVTQQMLENPSENDWLSWGHTYDGQNYSPLVQIDKQSVADLAPAWRATLRVGTNMPTPLVHAGIMFLHTFPDTVLAIDATNGQVLWRYQHKPKSGSSQKMGLGLSGDKVLVPTSDLHVLALSAKTGELLWDRSITTEVEGPRRGGYQLRSAPFIVGDKVIQGVTASFVPRGGFIVGLDIDSGEEVWRFNTIARPDEPLGNTWNGLPLDKRSGGSVWHQGTYDPELNLIYYGVAPTYDTGPLLHPVDKEGITSEAMYTNCTIALNPDTGELVWHYQHMQNDQWDLDWVFERTLVSVDIDGEPRKVVMNVGKMAILEAVDAATGEYLFSVDSGAQNVIAAIDPETGAKTYDPEKIPDVTKTILISPHAYGARSWPATSFSPQTGLLYVPITECSMILGKTGFQLLTSGVKITSGEHPDASDGMLGRVQAIDLAGRKLAWKRDQVTPLSTSLLATAGGVMFSGDLDPSLKAFDVTNGELLWQAPLDDYPTSSLLTYSVDDRQFVAVVVGMRNFHVDGLAQTYQEMIEKSGKSQPSTPRGGAAIWAFALE